MVAQGYNQQKDINCDATYASIARPKSIRVLLTFATNMIIMMYQMNVNSAFLNGYGEEEFYVKKASRFEDLDFPDHIFKLKKSLYGLKQALRAWYDRLKILST